MIDFPEMNVHEIFMWFKKEGFLSNQSNPTTIYYRGSSHFMEMGFFAPLAARVSVGSKHFMPPRGGLHLDFEAFRIILWQLALQPPKTNGWNIKMKSCKRRFLLWTSSFSDSISSMLNVVLFINLFFYASAKTISPFSAKKSLKHPNSMSYHPGRRSNVRKSWELLNVPAKRLSTGSCERFRHWWAMERATQDHEMTWSFAERKILRFSLRNVGLQKVEGIIMFCGSLWCVSMLDV